jgi:hypothetical protein
MAGFKSPGWASLIDVKTAGGVIDAISRPRLTSYGMVPDPTCDLVHVVASHGRNIVLCEALYPLLHILEVVVRNRVHDAFSAHYGTTEWFRLPWIHANELASIQKAEAELQKHHKALSPDNIVAELTFGFWCSMFNKRYEPSHSNEPWPALLKTVLPRAPRWARTRARILGRLEKARSIRNRVFHHEPVAPIRDLASQYDEFIELLGWFSPDAKVHLSHICRFKSVWNDVLVPLEPTPETA